MFKLIVHDPKTKLIREVRITDVPCAIGRSEKNTVVISEDSISTRHAVIERTSDGLVMQDLGSTNGITFGGTRLTEVVLSDGMKLMLGDVRVDVFFDIDSLEKTRAVSQTTEGRDLNVSPPPVGGISLEGLSRLLPTQKRPRPEKKGEAENPTENVQANTPLYSGPIGIEAHKNWVPLGLFLILVVGGIESYNFKDHFLILTGASLVLGYFGMALLSMPILVFSKIFTKNFRFGNYSKRVLGELLVFLALGVGICLFMPIIYFNINNSGLSFLLKQIVIFIYLTALCYRISRLIFGGASRKTLNGLFYLAIAVGGGAVFVQIQTQKTLETQGMSKVFYGTIANPLRDFNRENSSVSALLGSMEVELNHVSKQKK